MIVPKAISFQDNNFPKLKRRRRELVFKRRTAVNQQSTVWLLPSRLNRLTPRNSKDVDIKQGKERDIERILKVTAAC